MENLLYKSQDLIESVKSGKSTTALTKNLAEGSIEELQEALFDDNRRKTYWINLYNAYYQILRKEMALKPPKIFTKRVIKLAARHWSLDDIEHGILRKYRYKYSLGYLPNMIIPNRVRYLAVKELDYRIHFALNCGAQSCPPIAIYSIDSLDEQLRFASRAFLKNETLVDDDKKTVSVSRILFWFLKDFGGRHGIRNILEQYLNKSFAGYKIKFRPYSWTEKLDNFI